MAEWNPDDIRETLEILREAGLLRKWGETADGGFNYFWNDDFRDGLGGEQAIKIFRDVVLACGGIPFLGFKQMRVMVDLGAIPEKPDSTSAD